MASLEKVNEALMKLVRLIEPLKPLMKCHMVDYLTANHWETLLPIGIQQGLLNLPREKLYLMPSGALYLEDIEGLYGYHSYFSLIINSIFQELLF